MMLDQEELRKNSTVFLSYQMEDRPISEEVKKDLRALGKSVDLVDYPVSDAFDESWRARCRQLIQASCGTVVLIGSDTHRSEAVAWEVAETTRQGLPLLGVLLHETHQPPAFDLAATVDRRDVHGLLATIRGWVTPKFYLDDLALQIRRYSPPDSLDLKEAVALFRLYALLLLAKGADVTVSDVHNAWAVWAVDRDPGHDALVPSHELRTSVADADAPFQQAIARVAMERAQMTHERP